MQMLPVGATPVPVSMRSLTSQAPGRQEADRGPPRRRYLTEPSESPPEMCF